ncbi:MAG: hypothetical protein LBV17_12800 [Treponema sp.]|jgi:hypothetical protein|nr:hypothetical protein [Treponema sp.]
MKVQIKVMNRQGAETERVFLSEMKDVRTSKEVLAEIFRGKQAVGNDNKTMIRCGEDKDFYGVTTKAQIIGWVENRLGKEL